MKTLTLNGNNILDMKTFYDEIQRTLCPDFKEFGRNMTALDDVLDGGFGAHDYQEPINLIWENSENSKRVLDYEATAAYYKGLLETAHPSNIDDIKAYIQSAENRQGPTIFNTIVDLIQEHSHITLALK